MQEIAQARAAQAQRHMWLGPPPPVPPPRPPPPRPPPGNPAVRTGALPLAAHASPPPPGPAWPPAAYQLGSPPAPAAVIKTEAAHGTPGGLADAQHALAPASVSHYAAPASKPVTEALKTELPAAAVQEEAMPVPGDGGKALSSQQAHSSVEPSSPMQPSSSPPEHAVMTPQSAAGPAEGEAAQQSLPVGDSEHPQ